MLNFLSNLRPLTWVGLLSQVIPVCLIIAVGIHSIISHLKNRRVVNRPYSHPTSKITLYGLLVVVAVLISITGYQSYLLRINDNPRIIARSQDGGLNSLVVSYRDTVLMDSLPDGKYIKIINHLDKLSTGD